MPVLSCAERVLPRTTLVTGGGGQGTDTHTHTHSHQGPGKMRRARPGARRQPHAWQWVLLRGTETHILMLTHTAQDTHPGEGRLGQTTLSQKHASQPSEGALQAKQPWHPDPPHRIQADPHGYPDTSGPTRAGAKSTRGYSPTWRAVSLSLTHTHTHRLIRSQ